MNLPRRFPDNSASKRCQHPSSFNLSHETYQHPISYIGWFILIPQTNHHIRIPNKNQIASNLPFNGDNGDLRGRAPSNRPRDRAPSSIPRGRARRNPRRTSSCRMAFGPSPSRKVAAKSRRLVGRSSSWRWCWCDSLKMRYINGILMVYTIYMCIYLWKWRCE